MNMALLIFTFVKNGYLLTPPHQYNMAAWIHGEQKGQFAVVGHQHCTMDRPDMITLSATEQL